MGSDWFSVILALAAVLTAAVIRGYSGFGFAMVAVTGMSLVMPPTVAVPAVLVLDVAASIQLLPQVWRDVSWVSLRCLFTGSVAAIPLGVFLLSSLPEAPMRAGISILVLATAILLARGFTLKRVPGWSFTLWVGVLCGVLNGAAAIGGPPAVLFYLSSPAGVSVSRASMIVYFLGIDLVTLAMAAYRQLVTVQTLHLAGACLIPLIAGIALGSRIFQRIDEAVFRRNVIYLLIALASAGLLRSLF
ncbi:MAG TPA: sulfite exporter TauE/SafE family protein [Syntrophobacteria bacterium]|nr:sulfite exporter TauE/SafE family protein [Syntrophobacteria bacterium]